LFSNFFYKTNRLIVYQQQLATAPALGADLYSYWEGMIGFNFTAPLSK
jgi:hypothetical protein